MWYQSPAFPYGSPNLLDKIIFCAFFAKSIGIQKKKTLFAILHGQTGSKWLLNRAIEFGDACNISGGVGEGGLQKKCKCFIISMKDHEYKLQRP